MQETKLKLLERIVDRRQDSLYRFAYIRTGSQADAEDIVQDVLLRLFHSDCNLDRIDDVERYLWRAIANRCCDYHRHRRNATLPTERAAALADDSGDQELREEYERIAGLLATLPEEQAEVIRLKTSDSLTFARIAEITGTTEATVKSRFRYGIGKLRSLDLPGGRFFILFQSLLHPLKRLIIYDAWHAIRDQDIVPSVFTDIPPIGKDPRDRIVIERLSVGCFETPTIQLFDDLGGLLPTAIHLKDLPDDLCTVLINLEILVLIDIIPE